MFYVPFNVHALLGFIETTLRMDEMKEGQFGHSLAGCEATRASGLRFLGQQR